mmetsp:Transcript_17593/g.50352  ORF Transcript_17593/g.50352 Transcript_17593/m.50352 type:complete len:96 (+) Transcript_17593:860-1147(+)
MTKGMQIKPHTDKEDMCPQIIVTFGDFDGGMLQVKDKDDNWVDVDTLCRPTLVEGRKHHQVTKVTRGNRFCLIVFKNADLSRSDKFDKLEGGYLK